MYLPAFFAAKPANAAKLSRRIEDMKLPRTIG
jgi:hypothetical protein